MRLADITFSHAITLGPCCDDGRIDYTMEPSAPIAKGPGVYIVFEGETLVYIGSYRTGIVKRWVYVKNKDLYHFKKPRVLGSLKAGLSLKVFAQDEHTIKEEIGCSQNSWVNSLGIESQLIEMFRPPWNRQGKKSAKQRSLEQTLGTGR